MSFIPHIEQKQPHEKENPPQPKERDLNPPEDGRNPAWLYDDEEEYDGQ